MKVEQFVMAYKVDQDRIRAILPEGFVSLRTVMRVNTEIHDDERVYIEFNTPVEADGKRGWLNIGNWEGSKDGVTFVKTGKTTKIVASFFELSYTGVGVEGGCPAEKDNDGCFFIADSNTIGFRPNEKINNNKEFCDCEFAWKFSEGDAKGVSIGKTLPAFNCEPSHEYEKKEFTPENAASIPCEQVLGTYIVCFERQILVYQQNKDDIGQKD